jgi:hypothetical protein
MSSITDQIAALEAQIETNPQLVSVAEERGITKSKATKVSKPRKTPEPKTRCMARVWGSGMGDTQCKHKRVDFGDFTCFCKRHSKKAMVCEGPTWTGATGKSPAGLKFGRIDQDIPYLDVNAPESGAQLICVEWKNPQFKLLVQQHLDAGTAIRRKPTTIKTSTATKKTTIRRKLVISKKISQSPDAHIPSPTHTPPDSPVEPQSPANAVLHVATSPAPGDEPTPTDDADLDALIHEATSPEDEPTPSDDADLDALIHEATSPEDEPTPTYDNADLDALIHEAATA